MEILFTKSDQLFSKLIRDVTDEPVSHCAIRVGEYVVHSDFYGVRIESLKDLKDRADIVYRIKIPTQYSKVFTLFATNKRAFYDCGAFLFLGISLLARRYFKLPLPKSNLWQSTGMHMCTEWVSRYIDDKADSMITPYKLYLRLRENFQEIK